MYWGGGGHCSDEVTGRGDGCQGEPVTVATMVTHGHPQFPRPPEPGLWACRLAPPDIRVIFSWLHLEL
jgi:hypothetical protein